MHPNQPDPKMNEFDHLCARSVEVEAPRSAGFCCILRIITQFG